MNIGQFIVRACRRRGHNDYGYHLRKTAERYDLNAHIESVPVIGSALLLVAELAIF